MQYTPTGVSNIIAYNMNWKKISLIFQHDLQFLLFMSYSHPILIETCSQEIKLTI